MNLAAKTTATLLLLLVVSVEFSKGSAESLLRFHSVGSWGWGSWGQLDICLSACNLRASPCGVSAEASLGFLVT